MNRWSPTISDRSMMNTDFRDATPYNLVESYEYFERTCRLYRQGRGWRQQGSSPCHQVSLVSRSRQEQNVSQHPMSVGSASTVSTLPTPLRTSAVLQQR